MKPERIQLELITLPGWVVVIRSQVQYIQKTYAFLTHGTAIKFVNSVSGAAQEWEIFPDLMVFPNEPDGVPTKVRVRISSHNLTAAHFELARQVEAVHTAETETASASTPAEIV